MNRQVVFVCFDHFISIQRSLYTSIDLYIDTKHMQKEQKDKKIENIRYRLWSVHRLTPKEIEMSLLQLVQLQKVQEFIPMMRQCLKASKYDPYLVKYITLFDLLLTHYTFNTLLHSCLVEFYPKIVHYLNMQKLWPCIQQTMIIRKYWLRRIHAQMYEDLRRETYRLTSIDVDNIISVEAIQQIRKYYVQGLKLNREELFYYLPQLHQMYPSIYYNYNYKYSQSYSELVGKKNDSSTSQSFISKKQKQQQQSDVGQRYKVSNSVMSQSNGIKSIHNYPYAYHTNNITNNCIYTLPLKNNHDFAKRTHKDFEETTSLEQIEVINKCKFINQNQVPYQQVNQNNQKDKHIQKQQNSIKNLLYSTPPHNKLQNSPIKQEKKQNSPLYKQSPQKQTVSQTIKNNKFIKTKSQLQILEILNKLKQHNDYECNECGLCFANDSIRKQHKEQHIKNIFKSADIAQAKRFGVLTKYENKFKTTDDWINYIIEESACHVLIPHSNDQQSKQSETKSEQQDQQYNYKVKTQEQTQIQQVTVLGEKEQTCPLCCMAIKLTLVNNQWAFKDSIRISLLNSKISSKQNLRLMHIQCIKFFQQCQNRPPNPTLRK